MKTPTLRKIQGGYWLLMAGCLLVVLVAHTPEPFQPVTRQAAPLNVLLITADDLGLQVGCYGDPVAKTPHLDRLASRGMRFANAYVTQASCSPSRSSMLTGLYPHQNGQIGLANRGYSMQEGMITLPALLKKAGFRTGIIGKLHVSPETAFPFDVERKNTKATQHVRQVADVAGEFFSQPSPKPFFLMVNFFDPHRTFFSQVDSIPRQPYTARTVKPFAFQGIDTPAQRDSIAGFYNGIGRVDEGVHRVLEKLRQSGQEGNTLVIFVGDNGPPFARAKASSYEAGIRVPLLLLWPGKTKPNTISNALISTVDLLPTVLESAGISVPANLPGRSVSALLAGKKADWRQTLCTEFTAHTNLGYFPQRTIRNARYKLIINLLSDQPNPTLSVDRDIAYAASRNADGEVKRVFDHFRKPPPEELYDLSADPNEFHNLAGKPAYKAVQDGLRKGLKTWQKATRDPLLDRAKLDALTLKHKRSENSTN